FSNRLQYRSRLVSRAKDRTHEGRAPRASLRNARAVEGNFEDWCAACRGRSAGARERGELGSLWKLRTGCSVQLLSDQESRSIWRWRNDRDLRRRRCKQSAPAAQLWPARELHVRNRGSEQSFG